jgi:hypothetical protein
MRQGLTRWFVVLALGVALLGGLTQCVVVPAPPVSAAYVAPPPLVVVRPYRSYRPYYGWYPYRHYRWYPYAYP